MVLKSMLPRMRTLTLLVMGSTRLTPFNWHGEYAVAGAEGPFRAPY